MNYLVAVDKMHDTLKVTPLKEMDGAMLVLALTSEVSEVFNSRAENFIRNTIDFATFLHRKQTRANRANLPRTPYIEHPLRNALRALRWGLCNEDLIVAIILHDVAEDCAEELIEYVGVKKTGDQRADAIEAIRMYSYHDRVADIVDGVTNYPSPKGATKEEKRAAYVKKVTEEIKELFVFITKLVDFFDNATSLVFNIGFAKPEMVNHLALKYLPMYDVFAAQLQVHIDENRDEQLCNALRVAQSEILASLAKAKKQAEKIIAKSE